MTASQDTLSHDWWWLVVVLPTPNSPLAKMLWLVGIKAGLGSRFSLHTIKQLFSTPLSDDILPPFTEFWSPSLTSGKFIDSTTHWGTFTIRKILTYSTTHWRIITSGRVIDSTIHCGISIIREICKLHHSMRKKHLFLTLKSCILPRTALPAPAEIPPRRHHYYREKLGN